MYIMYIYIYTYVIDEKSRYIDESPMKTMVLFLIAMLFMASPGHRWSG